MTKDEALKLALEVLEEGVQGTRPLGVATLEAIATIKEALAQPEQEPVVWSHAGAMPPEQEEMKEAAYQLAPWLSAALDDPKVCKEYKDVINAWFDAAMPSPQRTWVGLTDEEFKQIMLNTYNIDLNVSGHSSDDHLLWNAIEAKLKEKNT